MATSTVKVIKVGTLCLEPMEASRPELYQLKYELGIGGGSTVTVVDTADGLLLVDTGFEFESKPGQENLEYNRRALRDALALSRLRPEDVDAVFITHFHRDHFGNLDLFASADHLCGAAACRRLDPPGFRGVDDGEEIATGVRALYTPGHTPDHCSLLVSAQGYRYCIAGDAVVTWCFFDHGRVWDLNADFADHDTALESMQRIVQECDFIVPGHGPPFSPHTPDWLRAQTQ